MGTRYSEFHRGWLVFIHGKALRDRHGNIKVWLLRMDAQRAYKDYLQRGYRMTH